MTTAPTTPRLAENCDRSSHSVQRFVGHHGLTHLDLFSGIGGFALAAASAGFKTIGFSEIEPYACKALKRHWPDVPNHGDIRNVSGVRADLVTGGFPCQPFSVAGKRLGKEDDRHLWPEMCRVIAEARPTWVLGENVPGIIGMELDGVLSDLENLGYACWPLVIPACACDARHRRDRLWVMAYSAQRQDDRRKSGIVASRAATDARRENVADTDEARRREQRWAKPISPKQPAAEYAGEDVSDADGGQHESGSAQRNQRPMENGDGESNGRACNWMPEPGVGRSLDGLSAGLDRNCLILESHKLLLAYGKTTNQRPDEVLSALRDSITPQNIQWTAGGCNSISAAEILLAYLRELEARPFDEARIQLAGTEALKASLRSVRTGDKSPRASSRPRQQQQCTGEHPDTLQALSRLLAQHSQKAWQISRWQDASTLPWGDGWEVGTPRVAHGIPNRPHRLKGLGNAIVPQVASEILKNLVMANAGADAPAT